MAETAQQMPLFDLPPGVVCLHVRSALDRLFARNPAYRSGRKFVDLLRFAGSCIQYSPFNAALLYLQNPEVTFVATAGQWERRFGRRVKPDARPLIILAPMRPVLFVFDLADTDGPEMPERRKGPVEDGAGIPEEAWWRTMRNLQVDGVDVKFARGISQQEGEARRLSKPRFLPPVEPGGRGLPAYFAVTIDEGLLPAGRYAALSHALGSIYCGHLGGHDGCCWKARAHLDVNQMEIEAASVAFIVCRRHWIESKVEAYMDGLAERDTELPVFSLDTVLKAAGRIWEMGRRELS